MLKAQARRDGLTRDLIRRRRIGSCDLQSVGFVSQPRDERPQSTNHDFDKRIVVFNLNRDDARHSIRWFSLFVLMMLVVRR